MKTNVRWVLAMIGLACMLPALTNSQNVSTGGTNPNVIVILADDLGYGDLGCYGGTKIKTPNIDRLATQGVRFTDFYVPAAICTPSRAALLTGRYPIRNGLTGLLWPHSKDGIDAGELTIAELLKTKGYATALIGKWHLGHQPQYLPMRHGFDYWYGMPWPSDQDNRHPLAKVLKQDWPQLPLYRNEQLIERPVDLDSLTQRYTQECIRFIEQHKDRPFFLYYATHVPHTYLAASKAFRGKSAGGLYGDMVEELDWSVGQLMETLKKQGLDRNTLIFFTSDNGAARKVEQRGPAWENSEALFHPDGSYGSNGPLRGGKQATFEGGVRVPAIAWGPGVRAGQVERCPAIIMDLLLTIAAAAGVALPKDRTFDGENLMPVLEGTGNRRGQDFFFFTGQKITGIRSGKCKLKIEPPSQAAGKKQDAAFLFDLEQDIGESKDLANPQIVTELMKKADQFMQSLGAIPPAKK